MCVLGLILFVCSFRLSVCLFSVMFWFLWFPSRPSQFNLCSVDDFSWTRCFLFMDPSISLQHFYWLCSNIVNELDQRPQLVRCHKYHYSNNFVVFISENHYFNTFNCYSNSSENMSVNVFTTTLWRFVSRFAHLEHILWKILQPLSVNTHPKDLRVKFSSFCSSICFNLSISTVASIFREVVLREGKPLLHFQVFCSLWQGHFLYFPVFSSAHSTSNSNHPACPCQREASLQHDAATTRFHNYYASLVFPHTHRLKIDFLAPRTRTHSFTCLLCPFYRLSSTWPQTGYGNF